MCRMKRGCVFAVGMSLAMVTLAGSSLEGTWGGDRLRVVIDAQGAAIQADCADGRITGPVAVKGDGSFDVTGTYQQHKGGPQSVNSPAAPTAARFTGTLNGDMLTLSILPNRAQVAQTFRLQRGASVKLVRCL